MDSLSDISVGRYAGRSKLTSMIIYHWYSFTCIREKKHHALAFSTSSALSACEGNESKPNMIMMQFPSKITPHLKIGQNIGSERASAQGVVAKRATDIWASKRRVVANRATEMNICALLACRGFARGFEDRPQGSWEPASCPSCMQMASLLLKLNRTGRFEMTELCGCPRHYHS